MVTDTRHRTSALTARDAATAAARPCPFGLDAEETDPPTGDHLDNTPQAFTDIDLIAARETRAGRLGNRLVGILHGRLPHGTAYDEYTAWTRRSENTLTKQTPHAACQRPPLGCLNGYDSPGVSRRYEYNTWEPVYGAEVAGHGSFHDKANGHRAGPWLSQTTVWFRRRRPDDAGLAEAFQSMVEQARTPDELDASPRSSR
jgi:hypothetical protein